jgi:hypothetical protein
MTVGTHRVFSRERKTRREPKEEKMSSTKTGSRILRSHVSTLALLLAGCGGTYESESNDVAADTQAITATAGGTAIVDDESIFYLQRKTLSSIGAEPVLLSNGTALRVDLAAQSALARHRVLEQEVATAGSALLAPADTVEEFFETEHTVLLVATTHMVVVNPVALRDASPIVSSLSLKGPGARPYAVLTPGERTWLAAFRVEMLKKPSTHPLGLAARRGLEPLWNAAMEGKGDLTITTTVEVPIAGLIGDDGGTVMPTFDGTGFDYANTSATEIPGFHGPDFEAEPLVTTTNESGQATTVSEFVNGFIVDPSFEYKEHWNFSVGSLTFKAGAWLLAGVRIPIKVTGVMSPTKIPTTGPADVESSYESQLDVDVIDADAAYYERAGLPDSELASGHELVFEGGAYVTIKLDLPSGLFDIDKTIPNNPTFDWGKDFIPPFGVSGTNKGFDIFIPSDITGTSIDLLDTIGGEAEIGVNVSGDGAVSCDYESLYGGVATRSTSDAGAKRKKHTLTFAGAGDESFDTTLAPLTEQGEKSFGYRLSNFEYDWDVKLTPAVTANLFIHSPVFDWTQNLGTLYFDFAEFGVGSVSFGPLDGTRTEQSVVPGVKSWYQRGAEVGDSGAPSGDSDTQRPDAHGTNDGVGGNVPDGGDIPDPEPGDQLDP